MLILIINNVIKLIVLDNNVILFGISKFLNVVIDVCLVLILVIVCFFIVLIICMLWFILMVNIKNGISIDIGFILKLIEVSRFSC